MVIRHLDGDMASIPPPELVNRLRDILLECEQFASDDTLKAVVASYAPLKPWHLSLPQANSIPDRVTAVIAYLVKKRHSDTKENALVLLVRLLGDRIPEGDERHRQLVDLADELERAITGRTKTKSSQQNINLRANIQVDSSAQETIKSQTGKQNSPCAVILTAIPVEYKAVRAHLTELTEELHPQGTVYERGKFVANGMAWDVAIVEIGAGNTGAAVEAERAINYFRPNIIIFVGVAGGIKDVSLGDVVAATKVYGYESGKAKIAFEPRPDVGLSTYKLIQRARAEARKEDWLQRLQLNIPSPAPSVLIAPIAAGEKVIASKCSSLVKFLQSNYDDAVAVEMEGRGLLQAAHANEPVSALIVRGISDLISGKSKTDQAGWQEIAVRHASAFAFEILAKINGTNNLIQEIQKEKTRLTEEISKLREQDSRLQEEKNRCRNDIERLNGEIKQQENGSAALEEQVKSVAPPHTITAFEWLAKRKEIAKEAVDRVFGDKSSGLQKMILNTKYSNIALEGFYDEIEFCLKLIQRWILTDEDEILEEARSPVYLPATAYQQVLKVIEIIAYQEIGENSQLIRDSLEILISKLY